jgi:hypothetical protein
LDDILKESEIKKGDGIPEQTKPSIFNRSGDEFKKEEQKVIGEVD